MRFIRLPWRIYRNEPRWIPPLIFERKAFLSRRKNPFFEHGEADYFLAWRGRRPVGRITAQIDRDFVGYQGKDWGFFGFFECEDDSEAAGALLDTAASWLAERGSERMVGPFDFNMNDEAGVLIEGHELRPMIRQPWQHGYYPALLEGAGLGKEIDLYFWNLEVEDRGNVVPVLFQLAEKVESEHGITLRHMRKRELENEIAAFVDVYNAAWKDNWGFTPMRVSELEHAAKDMRPILDENWLMACETREGETVGIALTVKDANQAFEVANGRLLPFGWAKMLWKIPRIDRVRVGWLGVKPEYQHTGVAARLYVEHFEMAAKTRQSGGEMGWILETNEAMNRGMEAMGGRIVKRYRVYGKGLRAQE